METLRFRFHFPPTETATCLESENSESLFRFKTPQKSQSQWFECVGFLFPFSPTPSFKGIKDADGGVDGGERRRGTPTGNADS